MLKTYYSLQDHFLSNYFKAGSQVVHMLNCLSFYPKWHQDEQLRDSNPLYHSATVWQSKKLLRNEELTNNKECLQILKYQNVSECNSHYVYRICARTWCKSTTVFILCNESAHVELF